MKTISIILLSLLLNSCIQINLGSSVVNVNTPDYIDGESNIIEGTELDGNDLGQESKSEIEVPMR